MTATVWDHVTDLPLPPIETLYNDTVGFWAAVCYLGVSGPVALYALYRARERTGRIMLLILLGGTFCAFVEPFADVLGGCWHPEVNQPTVFSLLGRGIPVWVCVGYFTYFGALGTLNYLLYTHGLKRKVIWLCFLSAIAADIFMENLMVSHGLYYYYGNQPLAGLGWLPLWWPPINALGEVGGIVVLCFLLPHLKGWRILAIPVVIPIVDLVSYALIAYPGIIAVNSPHMSPLATNLLGSCSWILAFIIMHVITRMVATDSPFRSGATVTLPISLGEGSLKAAT
jgi:hypothetical protein